MKLNYNVLPAVGYLASGGRVNGETNNLNLSPTKSEIVSSKTISAALNDIEQSTGINFSKVVKSIKVHHYLNDSPDTADVSSDQPNKVLGLFSSSGFLTDKRGNVTLSKKNLTTQKLLNFTLAHELGHGVDEIINIGKLGGSTEQEGSLAHDYGKRAAKILMNRDVSHLGKAATGARADYRYSPVEAFADYFAEVATGSGEFGGRASLLEKLQMRGFERKIVEPVAKATNPDYEERDLGFFGNAARRPGLIGGVARWLGFATGGEVPSFRGTSLTQASTRLSTALASDRGKSFSSFYDAYRKALPLEGEDRKLFNRIYASQSFGNNDLCVLDKSVDIYKKYKATGSTTAEDYKELLTPLGLGKRRARYLDTVLAGGQIDTPKLGEYLKGLEGPDHFPIDRNVINAVLGGKQRRRELRVRNEEERSTLVDLVRSAGAGHGMSGQQAQAAIFGAQSKARPQIEEVEETLGRLKGYARGGLVKYFAEGGLAPKLSMSDLEYHVHHPGRSPIGFKRIRKAADLLSTYDELMKSELPRTKAQREAINKYVASSLSGGNYHKINQYLGDNHDENILEGSSRSLLKQIGLISSVTGRSRLPVNLTLFRGLSSNNADILKTILGRSVFEPESVGQRFKIPSFTSTSLSSDTAADFGDAGQLHILAPKGSKAAATDNTQESELLFHPNQQFQVLTNKRNADWGSANRAVLLALQGEQKHYAKGGGVNSPRGTDTVPAMLTPGEFVINRRAAKRLGLAALQKLNVAGGASGPNDGNHLSRGGPVGYYAHGGSVASNDQTMVLMNMNHALQKVVDEMERLAVTSASLNHTLSRVDDLGEHLAHRHWMLESIIGHASHRSMSAGPHDEQGHHGAPRLTEPSARMNQPADTRTTISYPIIAEIGRAVLSGLEHARDLGKSTLGLAASGVRGLYHATRAGLYHAPRAGLHEAGRFGRAVLGGVVSGVGHGLSYLGLKLPHVGHFADAVMRSHDGRGPMLNIGNSVGRSLYAGGQRLLSVGHSIYGDTPKLIRGLVAASNALSRGISSVSSFMGKGASGFTNVYGWIKDKGLRAGSALKDGAFRAGSALKSGALGLYRGVRDLNYRGLGQISRTVHTGGHALHYKSLVPSTDKPIEGLLASFGRGLNKGLKNAKHVAGAAGHLIRTAGAKLRETVVLPPVDMLGNRLTPEPTWGRPARPRDPKNPYRANSPFFTRVFATGDGEGIAKTKPKLEANTAAALGAEAAWGDPRGRRLDPLMATDPSFAAHHVAGKLLEHGHVDPMLIAKYNAALHGGASMGQEEYDDLRKQAAEPSRQFNKETGEDRGAIDLMQMGHLRTMAQRQHGAASAYDKLRGDRGLDKQQDKAKQDETKGMREANKELGTFAKGLRWAKDELPEKAIELGKKAMLFGSSAAEAASPDAFSTLSGSWKLLAASFGETLIPTVMTAAEALQDLAGWFQALSPETKSLVGSIGGVVIALSASAMAIRAVGLGGVASSVGKGLANFAVAHPAMAGVGLAAGAAVGFGEYTNYLQQQRLEREQTSRDTIQDEGYNLTRTSLEQTPVYRIAMRQTTPDAQMNYARTQRQLNLDALQRLNADRSQMTGANSSGIMAAVRGTWNSVFNADYLRENENTINSTNQRLNEATGTVNVLRGRDPNTGMTRSQRGEEDLMKAHGLLLSLQTRTQPGYFSPEDMYKKIQLEALTQDPLKEAILQINQRQLDAMLAGNASLRQLAERAGYTPGTAGP